MHNNLLFIRNTGVNFSFISKLSLSINSPTNSTLNVFDRNAKLIHREKSCQMADYKVYDYVKEEVGYRVADRIFDIKRTFDSVLDLGCQRGHVAKHLTSDMCKKIFMFDRSESMMKQAEMPVDNGIVVEKKVFDEENDLPFEANSLDLIISSLK